MKKIFLIAFLLALSVQSKAQLITDSAAVDLNDRVYALVIYGNNQYLYTQNGLVYLQGTDPFEEYYRKIYSDSTITNPNTVIEPNNNINSMFYFLPPVNVKEWADRYIDINDNIFLKDIFVMNNGAFIINPDYDKYFQKLNPGNPDKNKLPR